MFRRRRSLLLKILPIYALVGIQLQDSAVKWKFVNPSSDEDEDDYVFSDPKQQSVEPTDVPRRRHKPTWETR